MGGRTDIYYEVDISDPTRLGSYIDKTYTDSTSRMFTGLTPCTSYCVRVTAHNGVSDQDPGSAEGRREEVCVETGAGGK